ncbi:MAG: hypothetical protein ACR5K7_00625 [Symbiopectobacterium sp.]
MLTSGVLALWLADRYLGCGPTTHVLMVPLLPGYHCLCYLATLRAPEPVFGRHKHRVPLSR